MSDRWNIYADWNPWHGCTKVSPGCKYCYVYRQDEMYGSEVSSSECRRTGAFNLPVKRKRDKSWKIEPGKVVFTCFTSDFLLKDADPWRPECWAMMRERSDLYFYFFTKRIDRFAECMPDDWGDGYDNVIVGCTVENQQMADYRLPIFKSLSIKHKAIIVAPMIGPVDLSAYLDESIEEVSVGGESGLWARPCNYDWVLAVRSQCVAAEVPFRYHQTGAKLIKDGRMYRIHRKYQLSQAHKADIDYRIGDYFVPETAVVDDGWSSAHQARAEAGHSGAAMGSGRVDGGEVTADGNGGIRSGRVDSSGVTADGNGGIRSGRGMAGAIEELLFSDNNE